MQTSNQESLRSRGTKVLAAIGLIVVVILTLWGAVSALRAMPAAFSGLQAAAISLTSIFTSAGEEQIELSASETVVDVATPFTLTWTHTNKNDDGLYALNYACRDGVTLQVRENDGTYADATCETSTPLFITEKTTNVIAFSEEKQFIDVPVAIAFTNDEGDVTATDSITITVVNDEVDETEKKEEETNNTTTTEREAGEAEENLYEVTIGEEQVVYSDPNGYADLEGRILEVGYIDSSNNFVATSSVPTSARVAVKFEVENVGTKFTPTWYFRAVLPTQVIHFFDSPDQRALFPGDKIEYTLGFDGVKAGNVEIVINVDPDKLVGESSEANNIVKRSITVYSE